MPSFDPTSLISGLKDGSIVPYIGPGALGGSVNIETGADIPADSDSLILAMNGGRPMAPKLMWEFPRAAMNLELKKGRSFITKFLTDLYVGQNWSVSPLHQWLIDLKPAYVIDVNRDITLQKAYRDVPHLLVRGLARIGGTDFRFRIDYWDGETYSEIAQEEADPRLPVLFKPMGSPLPAPATFIASDADYVDYITELMGGFAIPSFMKETRVEKKYLFLGMRFTRDTERMVMADITFAHGEPRGWALIEEPTDKELRYCEKMQIEVVRSGLDLLTGAQAAAA